jgi:CBS domain-containing protein
VLGRKYKCGYEFCFLQKVITIKVRNSKYLISRKTRLDTKFV